MEASLESRAPVVRRAITLEYLTVGWNVVEGLVAIGAALLAGLQPQGFPAHFFALSDLG